MLDGKFIRGTTPTHTFVLPFHVSLLDNLSVSYRQVGHTIPRVVKNVEECDVEENVVAVTLTQEESLSFTPGKIIEVQLKVITDGGTVLASPMYRLLVEDILDERGF